MIFKNIEIKNRVLENPQTKIIRSFLQFHKTGTYVVVEYINPFGKNIAIHKDNGEQVTDYNLYHDLKEWFAC